MPSRRPRSPRRSLSLAAGAALVACLLAACDQAVRDVRRVVGAESPHARYADRLREAGLDRTAAGARWIGAGDSALTAAPVVSTPLRETGYFAPADVRAVAYRFRGRRGQRVQVVVTSQSGDSTHVLFTDLFSVAADGGRRRLRSMGEEGGTLTEELKEDGELLVRVQPELLRGIRYTLVVRLTPSLAFPVAGRSASAIRSYWGAARDGGRRSHQGVDIFAPRGTPVLAASSGIVTRVGENQLGGRVVWLWDDARDVSHYYAHLDVQLARSGQRVRAGDTLGLVGNTGNARTTPPHLHFGLYRPQRAGAVDPLPFLAPPPGGEPPQVSVPLDLLGAMRRLRSGAMAQQVGTVVAARGSRYLVRLVDGAMLEVPASSLDALRPIDRVAVSRGAPIRERPDSGALVIARGPVDARLVVLGRAPGGWCLVDGGQAAPEGWAACGASGD